ncbi:hypothetical protein ACFSYB_19450 [Litchfieldia salsa]
MTDMNFIMDACDETFIFVFSNKRCFKQFRFNRGYNEKVLMYHAEELQELVQEIDLTVEYIKVQVFRKNKKNI